MFTMNKCYIKKSGIFTKKIKAYKVYDEKPESLPETFKKSRLVCFDEIEMKYSLSGKASAEIHNHSLTDVQNMGRHVEGYDEISEEKFDELYNRCKNVIDITKAVVNDEF